MQLHKTFKQKNLDLLEIYTCLSFKIFCFFNVNNLVQKNNLLKDALSILQLQLYIHN